MAVCITYNDMFPLDGGKMPPEEKEISKEIERILTLYRRGFFSEADVIDTLTSMVQRAELFAYAKGRDILEFAAEIKNRAK